ncbi:MAG: hypothetical protein Q9167_006696 [Letrouitia subvulpina]
MDPVSVLVAVGTTLKVIKEVWDGLQWMQRIYETYTEGDKSLQSIALECNIYGESIKTIGQWLKRNQGTTGLTRQLRTTNNAITLVQVSMGNVLLDLRKFQGGGNQRSIGDSRISREKQNIKLFQQFIMNRAKQQWFAETMRLHLVELRAHAATLHLTLSVIDLVGHTPDQKEKAPEKLEAKTGRLEKRLMLRQFLTKALEIKRAEIGQSPPRTSPSSVHKSPQKLTFYDVVQLARQQAFAEKTRKSDEDLIDLSDAPEPLLDPPSLTSVQSDLALLDWSDPMPSQQISPTPTFQNQFKTPRLDSSTETSNDQPTIAGQNSPSPLNPPTADLVELFELDASRTNGVDRKEDTELNALAETPDQSSSQLHELSEILISQDENTNDQPSLQAVGTDTSFISGTNEKEAVNFCHLPATADPPRAPQQSDAAPIDQDDPTEEASDDKSLASSAAPSIFSHSSSLTSATGCSLPGITEEDVNTRNFSQISLKPPSLVQKAPLSPTNVVTSGPSSLSLQNSPALGNHAESISGVSSAPTTSVNQEFSFKPQQAQPEDGNSLHPPQTQLSNIDEPDKQGYPWIVQAARDGDEEMVRKLLVSGADIQACHTSTRRHALAEAALQGHERIADLLIEEGCSLEYTDAEENTALHHACRKGHLNIAKSLLVPLSTRDPLTHSALINASGPEGQSALHLALEAPYQNVVMLLIQHKANVNARDASFRTPLHIAARKGNLAMCNYLLNEGAQLDAREAQSKTPLQLACEAGHYQLVQMMLDQSQLNATNMTFLTAFLAAVEYGHVQIAESFFTRGLKLQELKRDFHKPLTLAAKSGCLAMVELMIQENCDVNAIDDDGWNALHFASYHGHYQIIERLFTSGVSAKATTLRKETPLLLAVKRNHFPVAERLLRSDNDSNLVSAEDERGQQPVHHVVRAGSLEIFNLLLSNGGKIDVENSIGWQPLHIATAYGHFTLVERLLQQGANIEEKLGSSSIKKSQTHKIVEAGYWAEARWPYPGSRALHLACEYGREQIANLLISKGAKMEASCGEGWQPLHHAAFFGSSTLVETLLQGGANPHATTNEGKTASTLGFCTTGEPIPEEETRRIQNLLREAMDRVKKPKSFKVALKKASTVEEKSNLLRAATFSIMAVSRPPLHKAKTAAQIFDPASTHSDSTSSSHRPRLSHLPYSSPLPLKDSSPDSTAYYPSNTNPSASQAEEKPPALPSIADSSCRASADTAVPEASSNAVTSTSTTNQAPQSKNDTAEATPAPSTETKLSIQASPKLKRRTTFGLAKVKPGLDMSKLSFAGMGKPTLEIGKQTLEIGRQTREIGNKTLELGKQGIEMSKQGLEVGKQGLDIGKKGVDKSKQGYKKAKKFAKKGVGMKGKAGGPLEESKEAGDAAANGGVNDKDNEEGDECDDDAKSEFSLGEFAELGSPNF